MSDMSRLSSPATVRKGRGAASSALSLRFERIARSADGDFLDGELADCGPPPLPTEVAIETPRTAITRNRSPDLPFDRSINAYRGCEHGCIYCFARPTHAYLGLSPGQDFESKLTAKPLVPELLRRELGKPSYDCRPMALGTNTDPYQPIEGKYRITRQILEIFDETSHPVTITTKSARVTRDIDLLARLARRGLTAVVLSVTSLDSALARIMEPRASTPPRRVAAIGQLAAAGIPVHASLSPIIPAINDSEIERIVETVAQAGARGAFMIPVRLPHEVAPLFREWLSVHFPDRAGKVMRQIQGMRGGRDNEPNFFERFRPKGAYAAMLRARFEKACRAHSLNRDRLVLRTDLFEPPGAQLRLL